MIKETVESRKGEREKEEAREKMRRKRGRKPGRRGFHDPERRDAGLF